jgi:hypothetical protein
MCPGDPERQRKPKMILRPFRPRIPLLLGAAFLFGTSSLGLGQSERTERGSVMVPVPHKGDPARTVWVSREDLLPQASPAKVPGTSVRSPDASVASAKLSKESARGLALGTIDRSSFVASDEPGDGAIWVKAASYKASFSAAGFTYVPYLGWWAERNHPIAFTPVFVGVGASNFLVGSAPIPRRVGERRVLYDHGAVHEIYEARPEGVEQIFVLPERPGAGDVVVRLDVATGLEFGGVEGGGHLFLAPGLGGVRYGEATVVDAAGVESPATVSYESGVLEVRLSAAVASTAAYPLTIDPVISTVGIDTTSFDNFNVDVCFDVTAGKYVYTYEATFSATDHDVLSTTWSTGGGLGAFTYQDFTGADWRNPSNADSNLYNVVLVVAEVGSTGSRDVWGRRYDPVSETNVAAAFPIDTFGADQVSCDVGGDPFLTGPVYFCVVWQEEFTSSDHDIYGTTVDPGTEAIGALLAVDASAADELTPAIGKGNGTGTWHVAYDRVYSASDHDVRGRLVSYLGAPVGSNFSVDFSGNDDRDPNVGGDGLTALYVYERDFGTDHDIAGTFVSGSTPGTTANLTLGEPGAPLLEDQVNPAVELDECRFAYGYAESYLGSSTDYDVYVAAVRDAGGVVWDEGHVNLPNAFTSAREDRPAMASRASAGGAGPEYGVGFDDDNGLGADHDIHGARYEAHSGSLSTSVFPSACGAPAPSIAASGTTALNGTLTIATTAAQGGTLVTLFGFPGFTSLCAGVGPCDVGTSFPPNFILAGTISGQIPCEPVLVGGTISFQGVEYGFGLAGGCVYGPLVVLLSHTIDATVTY